MARMIAPGTGTDRVIKRVITHFVAGSEPLKVLHRSRGLPVLTGRGLSQLSRSGRSLTPSVSGSGETPGATVTGGT